MDAGTQIAIRQPEYCPHSLDIGIATCHRCDGTAVYTEAQLQQEIAKARIEAVMYVDSMLRFENIPLHPVQANSLKEYIKQLEPQTLKNES